MMKLILIPLEPETENSARNSAKMRNDAYCLDTPSAVCIEAMQSTEIHPHH